MTLCFHWPAFRSALIGAIVLGAVSGCAGVPVTEPTQLPAGGWQLDPRHTSVTWGVRHFGLAWDTGRFDGVEASLEFDPEDPESAQLTAIVDTGSVSSGQADLDAVLRGSSWLAADIAPQIVYRSTVVEVTGENEGRVTGDLTLRGETREVQMDVTFYGGNFIFLEGRQALGFRGDMMIDRREFGVGNLPSSIVGNTVRIHIEAEFLKN
jgi:polyisoprenoid-binding protein YceI